VPKFRSAPVILVPEVDADTHIILLSVSITIKTFTAVSLKLIYSLSFMKNFKKIIKVPTQQSFKNFHFPFNYLFIKIYYLSPTLSSFFYFYL
jgi:hypothetical protein